MSRLNALGSRPPATPSSPPALAKIVLSRGLRPVLLVVLVGALIMVWHLLRGPNFLLDDWFTVRNAHFDGPLAAAGGDQWLARPGAGATYAIAFGLIGAHPAVIIGIQGLIGIATAVMLQRLLSRFVPRTWATAVSVVWLVVPNHLTLETWPSAVNIATSVLLLVIGADLLALPATARRTWIALGLLAAAGLCYEASIPMAAVIVVALPWMKDGRADWKHVAWGAGALGVTSGWIMLHWHPAKTTGEGLADVGQIVPAHFAWGLAPDGVVAATIGVFVLAGAAASLALHLAPSLRERRRPSDTLVPVGIVIMVIGTLPFITYFYAPLGAGDRFNFVSAIGGAMVLVGVGHLVRRLVGRWGLTAVAVTLLVAAFLGRLERMELWTAAGDDSVAIVHAALTRWPLPPERIVLGPEPIQVENLAAYLDASNIRGALQVAYDDRSVAAEVSPDAEYFARVDSDEQLDIRPLSSLLEFAESPE